MIGLRTLINENCTINDALIMGADYYETLEECALVPGCLPMGLGESRWLQPALAAHVQQKPVRPLLPCSCGTLALNTKWTRRSVSGVHVWRDACAGSNTEVKKCIIDKNVRIGSNCKIVNTANVQEANKEEDGYVIKDGIVVVIKSSVIPGRHLTGSILCDDCMHAQACCLSMCCQSLLTLLDN